MTNPVNGTLLSSLRVCVSFTFQPPNGSPPRACFKTHRLTVAKDKRQVVDIGEPNREAGEWVLRVGGAIGIRVDGQPREVTKIEDLPPTSFQITGLKIQGKPLSDVDLEHLDGLTSLVYLTLQFAPVSDSGFAFIAKLPEVLEIAVEGTGITDAALAHLKSMPKLRIQRLDNTQITDAGLEHLKDLDLTILSVAEIKGSASDM
jgi:hypothetical protein